MKKTISVNRKSARGRPKRPGGVDPVSAVRLSADVTAAVDTWAGRHEISRSEAIRQLVELGLTVRQSRKTTTKASARAAELAAKVIDSREDSAASPVERDDRKRRLLKGPSAFRELRKDRAK